MFWRLFVRPLSVAVLVAADFRVRIARVPGVMNYAEDKDSTGIVLRRNTFRDIGDVNVKHNASGSCMAIAAVRLKYILSFTVLAAISGDFLIQR